MEIKRTTYKLSRMVRFIVGVWLIMTPALLFAQQPIKKYTVKQGKMFIEISRDISEASLDSFVVQFDLQDLYLKDFIKKKLKGLFAEKRMEGGAE